MHGLCMQLSSKLGVIPSRFSTSESFIWSTCLHSWEDVITQKKDVAKGLKRQERWDVGQHEPCFTTTRKMCFFCWKVNNGEYKPRNMKDWLRSYHLFPYSTGCCGERERERTEVWAVLNHRNKKFHRPAKVITWLLYYFFPPPRGPHHQTTCLIQITYQTRSSRAISLMDRNQRTGLDMCHPPKIQLSNALGNLFQIWCRFDEVFPETTL